MPAEPGWGWLNFADKEAGREGERGAASAAFSLMGGTQGLPGHSPAAEGARITFKGGLPAVARRAKAGGFIFVQRSKGDALIGREIGGMDRTSLGNEGALRQEPTAPVARGVLAFSGQS